MSFLKTWCNAFAFLMQEVMDNNLAYKDVEKVFTSMDRGGAGYGGIGGGTGLGRW